VLRGAGGRSSALSGPAATAFGAASTTPRLRSWWGRGPDAPKPRRAVGLPVTRAPHPPAGTAGFGLLTGTRRTSVRQLLCRAIPPARHLRRSPPYHHSGECSGSCL